jgi:hypothetical protein
VALVLAPLGPVLVDAGGDLRAIGLVDGEGWPVGVQDPFEPERDRAIVRLRDGALATSSIGGRRFRPSGDCCDCEEALTRWIDSASDECLLASGTSEMNTSTSKPSRTAAGAGAAPPRFAGAAKTVGAVLSFSSLALGSAQFYKVSSARLGPGAFMLSIPKVLAGSFARQDLSRLFEQRGQHPKGLIGPPQPDATLVDLARQKIDLVVVETDEVCDPSERAWSSGVRCRRTASIERS